MKRLSCQTIGRQLRRGLSPVTILSLILSLWGCLAIYNATFHRSVPFHFVGRQLAWLGLGGMSMLWAASLTSGQYRRRLWAFVIPIYLLTWLVIPFGIRINGMRGWFAWRGILLQPAEIAKPFFILGLACLIEKTAHYEPQDWKRRLLPALLYLLAWLIPLGLEPDFGAILVYTLAFLAVYWCFGGTLRHLCIPALAGIPILLLLVKFNPYLGDRLSGFLHPEAHLESSGWHIQQFQRTLASGGLVGRSWGQGVWSQAYLPLAYSDSMFAALGETVGFIGLLPIIVLLLAWVGYGCWRMRQLDERFSQAAVFGIVCLLASQAFIHLSVNLGLMPVTGLTLPLFSYGGSSLLSTLSAIGIVEGICRFERKSPAGLPK
jgi:cell division protein FtsW (lipid II flippase)